MNNMHSPHYIAVNKGFDPCPITCQHTLYTLAGENGVKPKNVMKCDSQHRMIFMGTGMFY